MKYWILLWAITVAVLSYAASEEEDNYAWGADGTSTHTTTTAPDTSQGSKRVYKPVSLLASIYYAVADAIIKKLTLLIVKKQKQKLEHDEPIVYPYKETYRIPYKAVNGEITIQDPVMENLSKFEVRKLESNKRENSVDFEIYHPKLVIDKIKHKWFGIILGYTVKGKGKIDTETTHVIVNGTLRYQLVNMTLQIADLNLDYRFEKFKMETTGINIPFVSKKKIDETLSKEVERYLRTEEPTLSKDLAQKLTENANEKLNECTLRALLKRLWHYLTSWTKKNTQDQDKKTFDHLCHSLNLIYNAP